MKHFSAHQCLRLTTSKIFFVICLLLLVSASACFFEVQRVHPTHAATLSLSECHTEPASTQIAMAEPSFSIWHYDDAVGYATVIGSLDISFWYCSSFKSAYARFTYHAENASYTYLSEGGCTLASFQKSVLTPLSKQISGCTASSSGAVLYDNQVVDTQLVEGQDEYWVATFQFPEQSFYACGTSSAPISNSCIFTFSR